MKKQGMLVGLLVVVAVMVAGCSGSSANSVGAATAASATPASSAVAASAKVVNAKCPIEGGAVDPNKVPDSLTREFRGQKVGFCCAGCPAQWDKLSDAEKEAKLKAVMGGK